MSKKGIAIIVLILFVTIAIIFLGSNIISANQRLAGIDQNIALNQKFLDGQQSAILSLIQNGETPINLDANNQFVIVAFTKTGYENLKVNIQKCQEILNSGGE